MKKETKELIKWIKNALNTYVIASFTSAEAQIRREKYYKSLAFLESLPEIESHLCRGGYVQDKNGTPCCYGDFVTFQSRSESKKIREGQLWWFKKEGAFFIRDELADWGLKEIKWFEKVKK